MTKRRIGLKQVIVTAILVLLAVSVATSLISKTVSAQATVTLYPTQGPVGQQVIVNGQGFGDFASVTISFNGKTVQQTEVSGLYGGIVAGLFNIPAGTPDGTFNVVVTDSDGNSVSAPFIVGASTATPLPATSGPSSPIYTPNNGVNPTYTPFTYPTIQPQNSGISPLIIGLIVVVVAVAVIVPVFFMFFRNSSPKRDRLDREPTYRPEPYAPVERPAPPSSPYNSPTSRYSTPTSRYSSPSSSRYTQNTAYSRYSARPTYANNYSAPASSVQQSTSGKVCPNCKRTVKGDYSVCPYCYKKMR